jgi:uncharacterized protein involved in exopolysaccharide biosynthesis
VSAAVDDADDDGGDEDTSLADAARYLLSRWKLLFLAPLAVGLAALGTTFLIAPTFTAVTTLLPPQQSQGNAAAALASLGSLAALAGGAAGGRSNGDQYVALMQSVTVSDRIIEQFKLMEVYQDTLRVDARKDLAANVRFALGKKDGLITIEVDDKSPERAAAIANRYVDELRRITATLVVTEAQQRRVFFEQQLKLARDRLVTAQQALQESGFSSGALKAEPKAAAEAYARLRADATSAEVRLKALRGSLTDDAPEVRLLQGTVSALREQLARIEQASEGTGGNADYISKYRDFKYQEALFELYARQFELARADESRDGGVIQVVDPATPPEKKSKPRRGWIAIGFTVGAGLLLAAWLLVRKAWRGAPQLPPAA